MTTTQSTLQLFLESEDRQTLTYRLDAIAKSEDIDSLMSYALSLDRVIVRAANQRIDMVLPPILRECSDHTYPIQLLKKIYMHGELSKHIERIVLRVIELYAQVSTLEEMSAMKSTISKFDFIEDRNRIFFVLADDRMAELVENDPRNTSFDFLYHAWRMFAPSIGYARRVEALMPAALEKETDIPLLGKLHKESFRGSWDHWNHDCARHLARRINYLIELKLPTLTDITAIEDMHWRAMSDATREKVDLRAVAIIENDLLTADFKSAVEYKNKHKYLLDLQKFRNSRHCLMQRIHSLCVLEMQKYGNALDLYEFIMDFKTENLWYYCCSYFETLVPKYFEENPDLLTAITWLKQYNLKSLREVVAKLISSEVNPATVILVLEYYGDNSTATDITSVGQERLRNCIQALTEPQTWFLNCLEQKKFYGCRDAFVAKTKEFVA